MNSFIIQQRDKVIDFYSEILNSVKSQDVDPLPLSKFKSSQSIPEERDINDLIALKMRDYATLM